MGLMKYFAVSQQIAETLMNRILVSTKQPFWSDVRRDESGKFTTDPVKLKT
jgi:hypothetical protein